MLSIPVDLTACAAFRPPWAAPVRSPPPPPSAPEVSDKLVVSLRDADSMPAGVVRAYVSELYQEVYDAACAVSRPDLDVRVLLPPSGASGAGVGETNGPTPAPFTFNPGPPPAAPSSRRSPPPDAGGYNGRRSCPGADTTAAEGREFTVDLIRGWATREVAELEPDLEVLFSDALPDGEQQEAVNDGRRLAGYPALRFCSLEGVASTAYRAEYFYAENSRADIPTFSSVRYVCVADSCAYVFLRFLLAGGLGPGGDIAVGVRRLVFVRVSPALGKLLF